MYLFNYKFTFYKLLGLFFLIYLVFKYCKKKVEDFRCNRGNKYKLDITEYDTNTNYNINFSNNTNLNPNPHSHPHHPHHHLVYLYWNGSFTSTFRLCQLLLLEEKTVQTVYINCCNSKHNQNLNKLEITTIKKIREIIYKKYPYIKNRLPPTIYVNSIQKDNSLTSKFDKLHQNNNMFEKNSKQDIYENLARFSFYHNQAIELPIEKENYHLESIFPYLEETNKQKKIKQINHEIIKNMPELSIFKNCVFSCTECNKEDMKNIGLQYYFYYLLQLITFCKNPSDNLQECGQCSGCEKKIIN